jgi:para-aminobenzoate synthetase
MRILLIDNYDSYTYNLSQLIGSVVGGQEPVVVRHDDAAALASLLDKAPTRQIPFDAIVISPGPGRPDRVSDFGLCRSMISNFPTHHVPILGVCLGHQGIVEAFGGRIVHAKRPVHGEVALIKVTQSSAAAQSLFQDLPNASFRAVRYHSLVAEPLSLPSCLEPLAWCTDEDTREEILMAVCHRTYPIFGVQFHIESVGTQFGELVLRNFCTIARAYRLQRENLMDIVAGIRSESTLVSVSKERLERVIRVSAGPVGGQRRVQVRRLSPRQVCRQPENCFRRLYGNKAAKFVFWLDSCYEYRQDRWPSVRWSFMGEWESDSVLDGSQPEFWTALDQALALNAEMWPKLPESDGLPPFIGGYLGYIGYELKRESFDAPRNVRAEAAEAADAFLGWVHRIIVFDHDTGSVLLATNDEESTNPRDAEQWMNHVEQVLKEASVAPNGGVDAILLPPDGREVTGIMSQEMPNGTDGDHSPRILEFEWHRPRNQYLKDVRMCLSQIRDGESYEICLTNRLELRLMSLSANFHPLAHYLELRRSNAAPFAAYLQLGRDRVVCCASPERFLQMRDGSCLESRPIKGTIRRSADPSEDARLGAFLAQSRKDRAENLMIVDLVRNDFGRVCAPGTVQVPQLMQLETFATVHQLVSTVQGRLYSSERAPERARPGRPVSMGRILQACFPMGSMTGAPKQRTMEIIETLEGHPRGIYSGSIGYVSADGQQADWNVVIRTAVWERLSCPEQDACSASAWRVSIGVGGAIVALSDPESEYEEMVLKAKAVIESIQKVVQTAFVRIRD